MKRAVQQFQLGTITAEVIEVFSPHGVSYGVAVRRSGTGTGLPKPMFAARSDDILDLIAVLTDAGGFIDHVLNGGSLADWHQGQLRAMCLRVG